MGLAFPPCRFLLVTMCHDRSADALAHGGTVSSPSKYFFAYTQQPKNACIRGEGGESASASCGGMCGGIVMSREHSVPIIPQRVVSLKNRRLTELPADVVDKAERCVVYNTLFITCRLRKHGC